MGCLCKCLSTHCAFMSAFMPCSLVYIQQRLRELLSCLCPKWLMFFCIRAGVPTVHPQFASSSHWHLQPTHPIICARQQEHPSGCVSRVCIGVPICTPLICLEFASSFKAAAPIVCARQRLSGHVSCIHVDVP